MAMKLVFCILALIATPALAVSSSQIKAALDGFWNVDYNRAYAGSDFHISKQSTTTSSSTSDKSSQPLFQYVNENKIFARPTYAKYIALMDNYVHCTGTTENYSNNEVNEIWAFLDEIMKTQVMKDAHSFLVSHGLASSNVATFKDELYEIWFEPYQRKVSGDTSGFEHVFVGELKCSSSVTGFHSWIQFYLEEKANNLNYHGYIGTYPKNTPRVLTLQFKWYNMIKKIGGGFIGTSPEYDFAVYSTCFIATGGGKCSMYVDQLNLNIQTWKNTGTGRVASAYPIVL
ncbi:Poly(U)-specific endoribonuclease [Trichoplax sp. H2]|uniref:Uridylate-specific endoribonuclease n=1 Tax=Trichoplax adhaerens TaxID=10228 RepID=B3S1B2_TRIAD|nr:expressed hypothetical protein [Trichoplax adhaerens]EDV23531.1 expressed hypothetical protein [Trichoplax adhaerens]RDD43322.1 Poly(U)-specific endoribonuclease [Trichoplax sp. H2]|eukprot:XP_002114441.1 expressed hypothetical protein [Trichoplax adhaerens]